MSQSGQFKTKSYDDLLESDNGTDIIEVGVNTPGNYVHLGKKLNDIDFRSMIQSANELDLTKVKELESNLPTTIFSQ